MRVLVIFLALTVATSNLAFAQSGSSDGETSKETIAALYKEAEEIRKSDPSPAEFARAVAIYEQLAASGNGRSQVRLGQIYQDLGRGEDAFRMFEAAAGRNSTHAKIELGKGHLDGSFGNLSNPATGVELLTSLSENEGNESAAYALAEAFRKGRGVPKDLNRAYAMYQELAENGFARASHRLGDMYRSGAISGKDMNAAIAAYSAGANGGYGYSFIRLSAAQLDVGRRTDAMRTLERAVEENVNNAEVLLAQHHCAKEFGAASDRPTGCSKLAELAEAGDIEAAIAVLRLHERRSQRIKSVDLNGVLFHVRSAIDTGHPKATEALARFYRELSWMVPNARVKHADLVKNKGAQMRLHRRLPEELRALYDPNKPISSRPRLAKHVLEADPEDYFFGFMELRSIDKNAFVYLLQSELRRAGYYAGRLTGIFEADTVRAAYRFCADNGGKGVCEHGPITYEGASYIVAALQNGLR